MVCNQRQALWFRAERTFSERFRSMRKKLRLFSGQSLRAYYFRCGRCVKTARRREKALKWAMQWMSDASERRRLQRDLRRRAGVVALRVHQARPFSGGIADRAARASAAQNCPKLPKRSASRASSSHETPGGVFCDPALVIRNPSFRRLLCSEACHQRRETAGHHDLNAKGGVVLRNDTI